MWKIHESLNSFDSRAESCIKNHLRRVARRAAPSVQTVSGDLGQHSRQWLRSEKSLSWSLLWKVPGHHSKASRRHDQPQLWIWVQFHRYSYSGSVDQMFEGGSGRMLWVFLSRITVSKNRDFNFIFAFILLYLIYQITCILMKYSCSCIYSWYCSWFIESTIFQWNINVPTIVADLSN